jgi:hypothetical protein
MPLYTFRDEARNVAPWWAARDSSRIGKLLYTIGLQLDGLADAAVAAIKMRYPGLYSTDSLALIGRERRIQRGPEESDEAYAARLQRWWEDHRRRGGPYAMLEQIFAFWSPAPFPVDLLYRNGRRFVMDEDGEIERDIIAWEQDEEPEKWARWWLFYEWPHSIAADGAWGSAGTYDDGGVWDSDLTVEEVANIRAVPTEWNNAHSFGTVVLLSDGRDLWDYPTGTWDEPGGVWTTEGPAQLAIG